MKKTIALILFSFIIWINHSLSQDTYKIGTTEYYYGEYYSTTGKPKVKRSSANKRAFLKSRGYEKVPYGYEIDHIIPLSEGGTDDPSNMQLLTIEKHDRKTAKERARNSNSTYNGQSSYYSNSTYNNDSYSYSNGKKIYTGSRGGKYYYNSNGKKTYIKTKEKSNSYNSNFYQSSSSSYTSTCGARNKSGGFCQRKVKGGGRCHSHK